MQNEITDEDLVAKLRARERLNKAVKGDAEALRRLNENRASWALNLLQAAGEASGLFRASSRLIHGAPEEKTPEREAWGKKRSREKASRRARGMIRH